MALRSDAARNRAAIVEAAARRFRSDGVAASLEEIAREAGVGSATLHRHFRGRQALLDEVVLADVERLCTEARDIGGQRSATDALWVWLEHVAQHCAADDAMSALVRSGAAGAASRGRSVEMLEQAGASLLTAAAGAGGLRTGLRINDLLVLVNAIAIAAAGGTADVSQLVTLVRVGAALPSAAAPVGAPLAGPSAPGLG